jgi:hypothetical protein
MSDFAKSELSATAIHQDKSASKSGRFLQTDAEFTRADWSIYISNLPQRAGVPIRNIRGLVLKELVDIEEGGQAVEVDHPDATHRVRPALVNERLDLSLFDQVV